MHARVCSKTHSQGDEFNKCESLFYGLVSIILLLFLFCFVFYLIIDKQWADLIELRTVLFLVCALRVSLEISFTFHSKRIREMNKPFLLLLCCIHISLEWNFLFDKNRVLVLKKSEKSFFFQKQKLDRISVHKY